MSHEESISLEETNKIRISLGLKPLTDDFAPADNKEKQAEDNYAKQRDKEVHDREAKKIQDRIAKVKNRRELNAKLTGATLGAATGEEDDTLKWIKRSKKKEKELAKRRQAEQENMDKMFQEEYTERDLEGLKVSHDFDEMDEGEARILTLKDSRILDNEEDELQNVEMAEDEKTKKNNELKIKKRDYTGYDDDEFGPGNQGLMKKSVLSKYDEDIEGPRDSEFRLGSSSTVTASKKSKKKEEEGSGPVLVNKALLSIDYAKNLETADYLKEGDVGFKKPKTKKKRPSRRAEITEDPEDTKMAVDEDKPIVPRPREIDLENTNFVDDDELQAALARSRNAKIRKVGKKLSPEEVAKKVAEERAIQDAAAQEVIKVEDEEGIREEDDSRGLIFDDTSEFVRSIAYNPAPAIKPEPRAVPIKPQPAATRDVSMEAPDQTLLELEAGEVPIKEEEDEEDEEAMLNAIESALKAVEAEEVAEVAAASGVGGTSSEETFSSGMASTLNILRQQGILAAPTSDLKDRERTQLQRDMWLADQRRRVAQRELERLAARGANKDQAQREYENRLREQQEARDNLEAFKHYKPDVNIVYYDEFGRSLTPKEAWKALSHKFHGKGSGKMKTEKRLKKIAEEKKKEAMVSGDTPLSMNRAFQIRQEKAGQAHFVLSVGNRGAVPQASEFLDPQPLTKTRTETKKGKKKEKQKASEPETGFMTLPAPQATLSALDSTSSLSMMPNKPGFSRISTASEVPGAAMPTDRTTKVAFGFGTKRKAGEDADGSPAPKKR